MRLPLLLPSLLNMEVYAMQRCSGHPNIADSFVKAKTQEDDHVVKIKTLMRRDLVMQTK